MIQKLISFLVRKVTALIYPKKLEKSYSDIKSDEFWDIYRLCKAFTMTSVERMYALYQAVDYIIAKEVPGHFVECGVWRGGSAMMIAKMLKNRQVLDRKVYLFDTFEGMSEPTENDKDFRGDDASVLLNNAVDNKEESVWCLASMEDVQRNLTLTGFGSEFIKYIKGKVEDTIPFQLDFNQIALLRLDTDWYESTKHELVHLYPLLSDSGILIIDDYGYWEGCRKAVDEYIFENQIGIFLNRIDFTGRLAIKTNKS